MSLYLVTKKTRPYFNAVVNAESSADALRLVAYSKGASEDGVDQNHVDHYANSDVFAVKEFNVNSGGVFYL